MRRRNTQLPTRKDEEILSFRIEVTDKNGKVIQAEERPSDSYVKQWNQCINVVARQVSASIQKTDGTSAAVVMTGGGMLNSGGGALGTGPPSLSAAGLVVGTGSTAVAIGDYALGTVCAQGTGANQFSHQAGTMTAPAIVGSTCSWKVRRTFINNSAADITVREIGSYHTVPASANFTALGWRDVLLIPAVVPIGGAITVEYTVGVTV
jgi:hypothetical protein